MYEFLKWPGWPLVTFVVGVWLGHRSALRRDRRNDFNRAAAPVRALLRAAVASPSPMNRGPSVAELDMLEQFFGSRRSRSAWESAWQQYEAACNQQLRKDSFGGAIYARPEVVTAAAGRCLRACGLR